jgi:hypothetical protein
VECTNIVVVVWHSLTCLCDEILMMYNDVHDAVNIYIMHACVNGLWYGLEYELVSVMNCCWCCIAR